VLNMWQEGALTDAVTGREIGTIISSQA